MHWLSLMKYKNHMKKLKTKRIRDTEKNAFEVKSELRINARVRKKEMITFGMIKGKAYVTPKRGT